MATTRIRKLTLISLLAIILMLAIWSSGCSSKTEQPAFVGGPRVAMVVAPAGSCQIDAVKMCQATTGSQTAAQPSSAPMAGSYGPPNMPESVEFQIPAG